MNAGRTVELTVLCEGPTEVDFVVKVLKPHLEPFRVFPKARNLNGAEGVSWDRMRKQIQATRNHQHVTTMVDLYALRNFPGQDLEGAGVQKALNIERAMQKHRKKSFMPYVQVHEFEALVLTDISQFSVMSPYLMEFESALNKLRANIHGLRPEEIDEGKETAPSKRIESVFGASYNKRSMGPDLVKRMGLSAIRQACPHFNDWLTKLEQLGGAPAPRPEAKPEEA